MQRLLIQENNNGSSKLVSRPLGEALLPHIDKSNNLNKNFFKENWQKVATIPYLCNRICD